MQGSHSNTVNIDLIYMYCHNLLMSAPQILSAIPYFELVWHSGGVCGGGKLTSTYRKISFTLSTGSFPRSKEVVVVPSSCVVSMSLPKPEQTCNWMTITSSSSSILKSKLAPSHYEYFIFKIDSACYNSTSNFKLCIQTSNASENVSCTRSRSFGAFDSFKL